MDIFTDKGFLDLVRIKVAFPQLVPDYVDNADLDELMKSKDSLVPSQYADRMAMRYPIHNKVATWMSAAYFARNHQNFTKMAALSEYIWEGIKEAAYLWGIEDDVNNIYKAFTGPAEEKIAEVWGWDEDGIKAYPLHNEELIKSAMPHFERFRDDFDRTKRIKIAQCIFKQARKHNIPVSETIRKEAGVGYPDRLSVYKALEDRATRIRPKSAEMADICIKMANHIMEVDTSDLLEATSDAVNALEGIDKAMGFHYNYKKAGTNFVERPVDLFYATSQEEANSHVDRYVDINGARVDCVKMAEYIPLEEFDRPFHDGFLKDKVDELVKQGSLSISDAPAKILYHVVNSMSDTDRWILGQHLSSL